VAAGAAVAVVASTGRETGNVTSVVPTTSLVVRSASSAVILEAAVVEAAEAVDVVVVGAPVETAAVERTTGERATGVVIAASNITLRDGISATSAGSLSKLQPAE